MVLAAGSTSTWRLPHHPLGLATRFALVSSGPSVIAAFVTSKTAGPLP